MRTHTCVGTRAQEPWSFGPEVEGVARGAIHLRYRLLPYLYTLAHEAHERGAPLFRPFVYDFPDDKEVHHIGDQVMVGPHLLIAPVTRPGVRHRARYLPEGVWYDFWNGERVGAGYQIVEAPLGRLPIFVRGGAVLPRGNERTSTSAPLSELTFDLYPAGESRWTLLEDAGDGFSYERGEVARTRVEVLETRSEVRVRMGARTGGYQPAPRTVVLLLHLSGRPSRVLLDGREADWAWDEAARAARVRYQDDGAAHELTASGG